MAWSALLNFRATAPFITDNPGQTYVLNDLWTGSVIRNGLIFGWNSLTNVSTRDRQNSAGTDPRLAGDQFAASSSDYFQLQLPALGLFEIRGAFGDAANNCTLGHTLADTTTTIQTYSGAMTFGNFQDATTVTRSMANWPSQNLPLTYNFTTNLLRVIWGAGNDGLAHLAVTQLSFGLPEDRQGRGAGRGMFRGGR